MYDLRIEVVEIRGFCDLPMEIGDYFEVKGGKLKIPEGGHVCIWALQSLMPALPAKERELAEENDWLPHTRRFMCPDPNGQVVFEIQRLDPATGKTVEGEKDSQPPPRLIVNENVCSGCRACEIACSFQHTGSFNSIHSRIRVVKDEAEGADIPHVCRQCGDAPCVKECPTGALSRDPDTRAVMVDREQCIACGRCAEACPFEAIFFDSQGIPLICDVCGGEPECVRKCPVDAIIYGNAGQLQQRKERG